jgi:L-malate glycosyltransferase
MNRRVLHIVSGDLWGGAEVQVLLQSQALQALGWDVHLVLFNKTEAYRRYTEAGISCRVISETPGFPVLGRELIHQVKTVAPDLLVSHGYKEGVTGFVASLVCGVPWVSTFHGLTENYSGFARLKMTLYTSLYLMLCRCRAKRLIVVSHVLAKELGFDHLCKLEVVHNVADGAAAQNTDLRKTVLTHPSMVIVGRLVPVKRVDLTIRAFSTLFHNWKAGETGVPQLYVIGDGPERHALEELASQLPVAEHIHFLGFRADAAELIADADLLLVSSDSEGIPTVILEALANCTPLVATNVGGIGEVLSVVPQYPAETVAPGDVAAFSSAIAKMLQLPITEETKQEVRHLFTEHFSAPVAARKLDLIYRNVIENSGS